MKQIIFTKHAEEKLRIVKFSVALKIGRKLIERILRESGKRGKEDEVIRAVGEIDEGHVLVVIYKRVGKELKVITFFPAKKGRYED